jgi:predicted AlkP superfamily pyrophosphatase or phosphodiesterase
LALVALGLLLSGGCAAPRADDSPRTVVIWISVDGLRPDYVEKSNAPFLKKLMREGAYSTQVVPVFPSLTFPSHVSMATGVTTAQHGIVSNEFLDTTDGVTYKFPDDSRLLQSEPIWLTASRQGIRTALFDFPLSYDQKGDVRTDYFALKYDPKLKDAQRLDRLVEAWRRDDRQPPLQLLMGYNAGADGAGHKPGPLSRQVLEVTLEVDANLARFSEQAVDLFRKKARPADQFYLVVSSDHGMAQVHTLVNFQKLLDKPLPPEAVALASANIAQIYLHRVAPQQRAQIVDDVVASLKKHAFLSVYRKAELPHSWGFAHPTRTGDVVATLRPGFCFDHKLQTTTAPSAAVGGVAGMHGYDPADCPDMLAFLAIWRPGVPIGGVDLGRVDSLRLAPTICRLLGIQAAPKARGEPLPIAGTTGAK